MNQMSFRYQESADYSLPEFGYKIHISGTIQNYKYIFSIVLPYLEVNKVSYKYLKDEREVLINLSDIESPAESGKLITIYPENDDHCLKILEDLYNIIPESTDGVYILSDRNYKNSNVIFYRFGSIQHLEILETIPTLFGPDGEEWQDFQKCYFDLPSWIDDLQEERILVSSYLSEKYRVESLLKQSNGGNIFKAVDVDSGKDVIIKESRGHVVCTPNVSCRELRENEWTLSEHIFGNVPERIEKTHEWVNDYYIYEYINGRDLWECCQNINLFSYSRQLPQKNLKKFKELLYYFAKILEVISSFHRQGIILNDIHANNFIVTDYGEVIFIDLETSYVFTSHPIVNISSEISLQEWNDLDGFSADCNKIGNLFLFLIGKLHIKNNIVYTDELKDLLLENGINSNVDELIHYLLDVEANIETALDLIKNTIYAYNIEQREESKTTVVMSDKWQSELLKIILLQDGLIEKYKNSLGQPKQLFEQLKREKKLGLSGLAGVLYYLNSISYDKNTIDRGIEYILINLVEDGMGHKAIKIGSNSASPYLSDGTAGIIQLLLYVDSQKYSSTIQELSESLLFEFAQFSGLWNGMLGIAITLLEIFKKTNIEKYADGYRKLLASCQIMSRKDFKLKNELIYVLSQQYRL